MSNAIPEQPKELLNLPNMLGEMQDFIFGMMSYPSRGTAGFASLATMTAFAQTNIKIDSEDGMGFNEYFVIQAPTGFGKEILRKPVDILNDATENIRTETARLLYSAPASSQGLHKILEQNRSVFIMADEYADWLSDTKNNGHKQQALSYLTQAYHRATGKIEPGHAVTTTYETVVNPRISILATTTGEAMTAAMTLEQAEAGALNRNVMFLADLILPQKVYTGLSFLPSERLKDFIIWLKSHESATVSFTNEGFKKYHELDAKLSEPVKRTDNLLGARLGFQAIKIAGLLALSDRRFKISPDDVTAAFNIRMGLYHRACAYHQTQGGFNKAHKTTKAYDDLAKNLNGHGEVYKSQLGNFSRTFKNMLSINEQNSVIHKLIMDGVAEYHPTNKKKLIFSNN